MLNAKGSHRDGLDRAHDHDADEVGQEAVFDGAKANKRSHFAPRVRHGLEGVVSKRIGLRKRIWVT